MKKILHIHLCSIIIITYEQLPYKAITSEDAYAVCGQSCLPVNGVLMGHKLKLNPPHKNKKLKAN